MLLGLNILLSLMFLVLGNKIAPKNKNKKIIYYDVESTDIPEIKGKYPHNKYCATTPYMTSIAFKEKGKPAVAFTYGIDFKSKKELKELIKPFFNNHRYILIGWNSQEFDDPVIRYYMGTNFKCKPFDIMKGYMKFVLQKDGKIKLNTVANQLGLAKDDVDPRKAFFNKEYDKLKKYNIVDVELLEEIDNKYNITDILRILIDTTKIKYPNQIFSVTATLRSYINTHNISIGVNENKDFPRWGGLNYYLNKGRFNSLIHYDIRSFYPYCFLALNASSNLNYDNIEVIEVSSVKDLNKCGSFWFNDDGTLQVKQIGNGKFLGMKLTRPFELDDGNSDIRDLTRELVEYKNNTEGNLNKAYKVLVNGLYGALSANFDFEYKHSDLSYCATFICRMIMFNCIQKFTGKMVKTDSIWVDNTITAQELNDYTATILNKYNLRVYDDDGSYLIQWENDYEDKEVDLLYIKDKQTYAELVDGKWEKLTNNFRYPIQKELLKSYIFNPQLNIFEWVRANLDNIKDFSEFVKLSSKQAEQERFDTSLSDKLGLPYSYDSSIYNYYCDDGYIVTETINNKCPPVNYYYALNLCTKVLHDWGFKVRVVPFKTDKKKEYVKPERKIDTVTNTKLDDFNVTEFKSLYDVIVAIYQPNIERGSRCNILDMAMVGTGARLGYDVRDTIDEVKTNEFGITKTQYLTRRIKELKTDGKGFKTLLEYTDKAIADEYTRLMKEELDKLPETKLINGGTEKMENKDIGTIILDNGYINTPDGVMKIDGKKTILFFDYGIVDFRTFISNNTRIEPIYEFETTRKTYTGHLADIKKQIYNEGLIRTENQALQLLEMLKHNNNDRVKIRNDGGYLRLEDLPQIKPDLNIGDDLLEFINNLDNSQAYALKSLLLTGFCNIIREKHIKARGIVKSILLYGAKYSGKTLLVNLVCNMFNENVIGFGDGGSPQSDTALRNALANTIGIVLCDECDAKMVRKKSRTLKYDIEAILKGAYQKELPKTSDLNNQGFLLQQEQNGLAVLTMNDKVNLTEALLDRVIAIEFDNSEELTPILDINKVKPELLSFGKCLAFVFGKKWDLLKTFNNNDEMVNRLLKEFCNEYDVNLDVLLKASNDTEASQEKITDVVHNYIINTLSYHIQDNNVEEAFDNNWIRISWIRKSDGNEVIIHRAKFNNFLKSYDGLKDGGISSNRIIERLVNETGINPEIKLVNIGGDRQRSMIYSYDDFLKIFNLNYE